MPNVEKQRERLISLLKELFQLDQPDLDFGFYRIMHAKAGQVTKFLEKDLLGIIRDAFGEADGARVEQARADYEAARKQAEEFGAPDPDAAPKVKEAKAAWDAAKESGSNEGDVYDHLYRFFERYYDNGDFMSRRYFARETDGKAAPYAVPYDGREVYLHWANRDQYYIKTSEYLTNFTFDPTQAKEFKERHGGLFAEKPLKVHCRIVSASEGEHNNVKATEQTERYFIIHEPEPVKIETGDTGEPELVIQFQYRPDPEKTGQEGTWRKKRLDEAAETVKARLPELDGAGDYVTALTTPAPTEKEKERTLLEKYLAKYTARNTMDYFIHKDLGGFLRRELDFYIKNEVMRLDDIESADAPRVEAYLAKIKVLRRVANHLIDFLAQLEDFQKKLWLKKKFVVDTQYCITLDRIPEEFYPEIAANEAQRQEWVDLFAIGEVDGYSSPLTTEFLKSNRHLSIDTGKFSQDFSDRLISSIPDLGEALSGDVIDADNMAGIGLALRRFRNHASCIYIDPPYNSAASEIIYKNSYKHSSWLSFLASRVSLSKGLLGESGVFFAAIDDNEAARLELCCQDIFGEENHLANIAILHNPKGRDQAFIAAAHEYTLMFAKNRRLATVNRLKLEAEEIVAKYPKEDERGRYRELPLRRRGSAPFREDRPFMYYPFLYNKNNMEFKLIEEEEYTKIYRKRRFDDEFVEALRRKYEALGFIFILPIREDGSLGRWRWGFEKSKTECGLGTFFLRGKDDPTVYAKDYVDDTYLPKSLWFDTRYDASTKGTNLLKDMLPGNAFDYPKSIYAVEDLVYMGSPDQGLVVDYFAGSGTTAHSVINLNRKYGSKRRYLLMEMGRHAKEVVVPRIRKAAYSSTWKNGGPVERDSTSHAFRYLRLETYEDALNNLSLKAPQEMAAADRFFARDYMLRYWLDFETKGSPSLLNIEWFDDPTAYKLKIKKPGTDEYVEKAVDLVETFNWLIGLHVEHLDRWRGYDAAFKREVDPELPEDTNTRLMLDGALKETDDGAWRFRKVEGYTLRTPGDHNDREKVLVVWRKLTGDLEQDNLMLDEWFRKYRLSAQDTEFDVIYVNGSNNLPNLRKDEETWKVRLIEEAFHQAMWDVEG